MKARIALVPIPFFLFLTKLYILCNLNYIVTGMTYILSSE